MRKLTTTEFETILSLIGSTCIGLGTESWLIGIGVLCVCWACKPRD